MPTLLRPRCIRAAIAAAAAAAYLGSGAFASPGEVEQAVALYDAGNYAEARPILERLDGAGQMTGAVLYRLFFCRSAGGDRAGAQQALDRAREALEKETASGAGIESWFYLANTYSNLNRGADARRAASEALSRVEGGKVVVPKTPMSRFQFGKLCQDVGRNDDAARAYREALDGFAKSDLEHTGSERWARRFLGDAAFAKADFAAAADDYTALVGLGGAQAPDYNRLAVARARAGRYSEASEAWRETVRLDQANSDDPRYSARVAQLAAELGKLPPAAPSGAPWGQLSKEDLEGVLKDQSEIVKTARAKADESAKNAKVAPEARKGFEKVSAAAKRTFVAAALEYACRGLPIRETSFSQGYAVLIFQNLPWEWPESAQN